MAIRGHRLRGLTSEARPASASWLVLMTLQILLYIFGFPSFTNAGLFHCPLVCLFIYFWLCWIFISVRGLPLVAASRGSSLAVVCGLLIAGASLGPRVGRLQ